MCPTCDGREPEPHEEAYASCFFCAFDPEPDANPGAFPSRSAHPSDMNQTRVSQGVAAKTADAPSTGVERVPRGTPAGGQFAASARAEANLHLLAGDPANSPTLGIDDGPAPEFPDWADLLREFPNRHQRHDRYNERLHAVAMHPDTPPAQRHRAARAALTHTLSVQGQFHSIPFDDGSEHTQVAVTAAEDPQKVAEALARVGHLADHDARTFGDRVAGALVDISEEQYEARRAATFDE